MSKRATVARRYAPRPDFIAVRMQRVQTLTRFETPLMTITFDCTFGLNIRLVRRFEKLTLWPNTVVLPQTSHLPLTRVSLSLFFHRRWSHRRWSLRTRARAQT